LRCHQPQEPNRAEEIKGTTVPGSSVSWIIVLLQKRTGPIRYETCPKGANQKKLRYDEFIFFEQYPLHPQKNATMIFVPVKV
jgi:hypothetical protein